MYCQHNLVTAQHYFILVQVLAAVC